MAEEHILHPAVIYNGFRKLVKGKLMQKDKSLLLNFFIITSMISFYICCFIA